jgi:hypothetical protein
MKRFVLLTVTITLGLLEVSTSNLQAASANTNAMIVSFQITGIVEHTTIVTNSGVVTTTYATTPVKLGNQNILDMLQAEFGTTFPVGAQLAYNLRGVPGFHVLDKNGNSILNVSTNVADSAYVFTLSNKVAGATAPILFNGKLVNNMGTTDQTEIVTETAPDWGIYFKDSHGDDFHLDGLLTIKVNTSITSSNATYNTISFTIAGSGGGTFFNPIDGLVDTGVFTKARFSAKGANIIQ